jgi:ADP-ribose pyrophosphatase YjhB (NUDIX family)
MGAKAAVAVIGDLWAVPRNGGEPDRGAAEAAIRALRPDCAIEPAADGLLADVLHPHPRYAHVAVLPEAAIACDQMIEEDALLEFAAGRPVVVFEQHSGPGSFRFTEWSADGTEVRYEDEYDLADEIAEEVFGFAAETVREELVMRGFLVTPPNQAEIDAAFDAAVAAMPGFTAHGADVTS